MNLIDDKVKIEVEGDAIFLSFQSGRYNDPAAIELSLRSAVTTAAQFAHLHVTYDMWGGLPRWTVTGKQTVHSAAHKLRTALERVGFPVEFSNNGR